MFTKVVMKSVSKVTGTSVVELDYGDELETDLGLMYSEIDEIIEMIEYKTDLIISDEFDINVHLTISDLIGLCQQKYGEW